MKKQLFTLFLGLSTLFIAAQNGPPINDDCVGAYPITPALEGSACPYFHSIDFSKDGTTTSGMISTCNSNNPKRDQFFTWTASSNSLIYVSNYNDFHISVYTNSSFNGNPSCGVEIDCGLVNYDNTSGILSGWDLGDSLIIRVASDYYRGVSFCLQQFEQQPPPSHDICSNAIPLITHNDLSCVTYYDSTRYSTFTGIPFSCNSSISGDLWYSFVASSTEHTIQLYDLNKNLTVQVLSGACGNLSEVSCELVESGETSGLGITGLIPTITYYVRINLASSNNLIEYASYSICIGTLPNDNCQNASNVVVSTDKSQCILYQESMQFATNSLFPRATCNDQELGIDLFYKFIPSTEVIALDFMTNDPYYFAVQILSGSCQLPTEVFCAEQFDILNGKIIDGLTIGDEYILRVSKDQYYYYDNTEFSFCIYDNSPISVTCDSVYTYCYGDNENTIFSFVHDSLPMELNFSSGTFGNCCDQLTIYDGPNDSYPVLFITDYSNTDLAGLSIQSSSNEIAFLVTSDCESNQQIVLDPAGTIINVVYDSGTSIELTAGFEVTENVIFHAFIDGCGGAQ